MIALAFATAAVTFIAIDQSSFLVGSVGLVMAVRLGVHSQKLWPEP